MKYVLLLALSQVADVASTGFSLHQGSTEINPLVNTLLLSGGLGLLFFFKLGVVILAALIVRRAATPKALHRITTILLVLSLMTFSIAGWNVLQGMA